ncbi:MAG: putative signal transducing protein [Flavobacteriaceae bacterium]
MSQSSYQHLYTGSNIDVLALLNALADVGITPVVKDESESARLAGFGVTTPLMQRVFVHKDELDKAQAIVSRFF